MPHSAHFIFVSGFLTCYTLARALRWAAKRSQRVARGLARLLPVVAAFGLLSAATGCLGADSVEPGWDGLANVAAEPVADAPWMACETSDPCTVWAYCNAEGADESELCQGIADGRCVSAPLGGGLSCFPSIDGVTGHCSAQGVCK